MSVSKNVCIVDLINYSKKKNVGRDAVNAKIIRIINHQ